MQKNLKMSSKTLLSWLVFLMMYGNLQGLKQFFSATLGGGGEVGIDYAKDTILKFTDLGTASAGYALGDGLFTPAMDGTYFFTLCLCCINGGSPYAGIMKTTAAMTPIERLAHCQCTSVTGDGLKCCVAMVALNLVTTDRITVRTLYYGGTLKIYGQMYTSFVGVFLG